MARSKKPEKTGAYHRQFADAVIEEIRQGTAPWQKPWRPGESYRPTNAVTGKPYTGGNSLYLAVRGDKRGFTDSRWATYKQVEVAGGQVRKGERGERILFFDNRRKVAVEDGRGRAKKDADGRQVYRRVRREVPLFRTYTVFNVEQAAGLKLERQGGQVPPEWQAHQAAEAVIEASKVRVDYVQGDRAFYDINNDLVVLPERSQFAAASHYYQTTLHELGHATGHPDRMDRESLTKAMKEGFRSPAYAKEELRAEIAAMMTGERVGVGHDPARGAAYIESWIEALNEDPLELHRAAGEAERISNYLMDPARARIQAIADQNHKQAQEMAMPNAPAISPALGQQAHTPPLRGPSLTR